MVKLNFNESSLRHIGQYSQPDREGRLLYRTSKDSYRERWFRLCGNLLFYFRTNELGAAVDLSDPVGVLVLADCRVQLEHYGDRPFVFSIVFFGEEGRKHFFSGQSQQLCQEWVDVLNGCMYSALRSRMVSLQTELKKQTESGASAVEQKASSTASASAVLKPLPVPASQSSARHSNAIFYVDSTAASSQPTGTAQGFLPLVHSHSSAQKATALSKQTGRVTAQQPSSKPRTDQAAVFFNWETFN